jgi:hypothetical protein
VVKVEGDKQNTKTMKFVKEFIKIHDIWKKINPDMKWKKQDETTTKEEKEVKKKIEEAQQRFKYYHDKKQRPHIIRMEDWYESIKRSFYRSSSGMITKQHSTTSILCQ